MSKNISRVLLICILVELRTDPKVLEFVTSAACVPSNSVSKSIFLTHALLVIVPDCGNTMSGTMRLSQYFYPVVYLTQMNIMHMCNFTEDVAIFVCWQCIESHWLLQKAWILMVGVQAL